VLRYDDGSLAILQDANQLEEYVIQNSSQEIRRKRQIRLALRSLEGKTVQWPYQHVTVRIHVAIPIQIKDENVLVCWCASLLAFAVLPAESLLCRGIQAISDLYIADQTARASNLERSAAWQWF
jgi:hypothetical protein